MTAFRTLIASFVLLAALLPASRMAHAAQSYDNCTGFIDSLPASISTQGVWCLKHDLSTNMASGNAIEITGNNITIDCNDFKLGGLAAGPGSQAIGIFANNHQNATIRHCNVRGFQSGVYLAGAGHLVEDNRFDNNLLYGIVIAGERNLVQRNRVYATGGQLDSSVSIAIFTDANVIDNEVDGVFATATPADVLGIVANGVAASGNRVGGLVPNGDGVAEGIGGDSSLTSAVGNQVTITPGIANSYAFYSVAYCMGNTAANFATPYSCGVESGNLPVP